MSNNNLRKSVIQEPILQNNAQDVIDELENTNSNPEPEKSHHITTEAPVSSMQGIDPTIEDHLDSESSFPFMSERGVMAVENVSEKSTEDIKHQILNQDDPVLYKAKSFFPLDLFPNELIIREKSITIITRNFLTAYTQTMLIKDVGLVSVNQSLFFAMLQISYKIPTDDIFLSKMPKKQAQEAKILLDRLMMAINQDQEVLSSGTDSSNKSG